MQARACVLVAPDEYELSGFLRARQGTAHAMGAPHPAGARVVALDQRLTRLAVSAHEWGEPLRVVVPPAGAGPEDARAAALDLVPAPAALRPWAPAHLRARRGAGGEVAISWVRCARMGGDSWGAGEPPMGAEGELYRLEVLDGASVVRAVETPAPAWTYAEAEQVADFGSLPAALMLRVAQMDASGRPGLNSTLTITL